MKKTVTINISGIAFTIDEDAYEKLSIYLNTIKSSFSASEGRDEIMTDIEARIAEMLQGKVSEKRHVISIQEIEEVIGVMGQPEDYIDGEMESETSHEKKEETKSQTHTTAKAKRVYRDPDSNVIGGVCSGIGHYFGFDPLWLRIAFAVAFFVWGTGILLYILLWIIIPEAKTTAEKLEMKGEAVNVDSIGKAVEEEMDNLKKKINDLSDKAKNIDTRQYTEKAKDWADKAVEFISAIFGLIFNVFGKVIGVVAIIIGVIFSIVLLSSIFGKKLILSIHPNGIDYFSFDRFPDFIFNSPDQTLLAIIGIVLLVGIPILGVLYSGIKLVFGITNSSKNVGVALASLWIVGVILCGVVGFQVGNDFVAKGKTEKTFILEQPISDTLYLNTSKDIFELSKKKRKKFHKYFMLKAVDNTVYFGNPVLDIQKSETDSFAIKIIQTSRGATRKEAADLSDRINYEYVQNGNEIKLNTFYSIAKNKWRGQYVEIILQVPEGKAVHLSEKLDRIIYDVENTTDTYDGDMVGKTWTMLTKGLTCVGCNQDEL
ncbi:MAG: hypothetical protein COA57_04275 [Flavobacteriales bacterium]|nr:MAG: hypothetical protein COA57_04275 [Flavobacteriales bacterium]